MQYESPCFFQSITSFDRSLCFTTIPLSFFPYTYSRILPSSKWFTAISSLKTSPRFLFGLWKDNQIATFLFLNKLPPDVSLLWQIHVKRVKKYIDFQISNWIMRSLCANEKHDYILLWSFPKLKGSFFCQDKFQTYWKKSIAVSQIWKSAFLVGLALASTLVASNITFFG